MVTGRRDRAAAAATEAIRRFPKDAEVFHKDAEVFRRFPMEVFRRFPKDAEVLRRFPMEGALWGTSGLGGTWGVEGDGAGE